MVEQSCLVQNLGVQSHIVHLFPCCKDEEEANTEPITELGEFWHLIGFPLFGAFEVPWWARGVPRRLGRALLGGS